LAFIVYRVFRRCAGKNRTQKIGKEHAAAHPELVEGGRQKARLSSLRAFAAKYPR
jgi:hypothetical protein